MISCEFHIMYPDLTHLLIFPHHPHLIFPPTLQPPPFSSNVLKIHLNMEAVVCHRVYTFVHTSALANVHDNESLVWFQASGF